MKQQISHHTCGLCGARFTWDPDARHTVCSACPLGSRCDLVVCPNCGYEFPARSAVADWVTKLIRRRSDRK